MSTALVTLLAVFLISLSSAPAREQNPSSMPSPAFTIEGTVRNAAGEPVAEATVRLVEKNSQESSDTKTRADGTFVLSAEHAGTYTLRAEKAGWGDTVTDALALTPGVKKHVELVLHPLHSTEVKSAVPPSNTSAASMEFKDEPSFTVAGVTDWSNLGLHGSAASSRTSESLAKQTLTLKPNDADASSGNPDKQYAAALALRDKGDFSGAREQVRKELAIADNAEGHRLLGELDEQLNDPLPAVHEYEQAVRLDPSERNYFEWGTELLLHKAAEPAAEVFARGSAAHPNSARMLAGLGAALYASGSPEEAVRRLCEASDLQPTEPAAYLFLGKIEKTSPSRLPCTEQKLARFAEQQPGNALANYYYAISLSKRNKESRDSASSKQVEDLLEKAIAIDPRLDEAYLQLGILRFARGDSEAAIRDYKKAIQVNPHLGEAHRQLGLLYQRTNEQTKAQQEFAVYEQIEKIDASENEKKRRELRQFLIVLKSQPAGTPHQ